MYLPTSPEDNSSNVICQKIEANHIRSIGMLNIQRGHTFSHYFAVWSIGLTY